MRTGLVTLLSLIAMTSVAAAQISMDRTIRAGNVDAISELVERGIDVNEPLGPFSIPPVSLAAIRGDEAMVRRLIEAGADVNATDFRGVSALSAAARSCKAGIGVFEALLDAGADIESRSGASLTPLLAAIQGERSDVAELLISRGADVNTTNQYGDGVLNYAIYFRMPAIIAMALDRDADTEQLRLLYRNDIYYYPNFGRARPHAAPEHCLPAS